MPRFKNIKKRDDEEGRSVAKQVENKKLKQQVRVTCLAGSGHTCWR